MDENEIQDVDASLEPEPTPPMPREREGVPWGAILLGVWAIALVIFSVQNAEDATVEFFGWSFQMPVALLVIVTALVSVLLTALGSAFFRRRRRKEVKRKRERESDD